MIERRAGQRPVYRNLKGDTAPPAAEQLRRARATAPISRGQAAWRDAVAARNGYRPPAAPGPLPYVDDDDGA